MSFKYELGYMAKDKITSFEGLITSRVEYLTGCNRYHLQPRVLNKDNQPADGQYFDEDLLVITDESLVIPLEAQKGVKPGACSPDPVK